MACIYSNMDSLTAGLLPLLTLKMSFGLSTASLSLLMAALMQRNLSLIDSEQF